MAATFPGTHQNFVPLHNKAPLAQSTINQQQFPYHTFMIVETAHWQVVRQHTLIINPTDLSMQEQNRSTTVQTLGGAYVDDFGRGIPKATISGNTGWRLKAMPDGTALMDGWQAFKALRNDVFRYFTDAKDSVRTYLRNPNYHMRWYNWGQDEYYTIQPTEFDLTQSASNPLLYNYTFTFDCINDVGAGMHQGHYIVIDKLSSPSGAPSHTKITPSVTNLGALASKMK